MGRRLITVLLLVLAAVTLQTLLPLVSGVLTIANPYLALLVVLALRTGKMGGVLWGAALGVLSDAYFLPYVGFHGLAFTLVGYMVGWLGSKLLIQGVFPVVIFTLGAHLVDAGIVAGLYLLLGLPLATPILVPALLGSMLTAGLAALFEPVAGHFYPQEKT
jgi:rod shape-determining protein MreD